MWLEGGLPLRYKPPHRPRLGRYASNQELSRHILAALRYSTVSCPFTPVSVFRRVPTGTGRNRKDMEIMQKENLTETVGEYEIPVDPMDDLQCDSCQ